jgi:O-antigen/teichoic acid export membrane protein
VSLLRSTFWSAAAAIAISAGRFLLTIILARKLGVAEFGQYAFFQWLVAVTFSFFAFGLTGAASRYYAEYKTHPDRQAAFERWFIPRSLAVIGMVAVASPLVATAFKATSAPAESTLLGLWSAVDAVWALLLGRAQGLQQFRTIAISNGIYSTVAVCGAFLLPARCGVAAAMVLMIVVNAAGVASVWRPLHGHVLEASARPAFDTLTVSQYTANVWISTFVAGLVWSRGEISVVRATLGRESLAVYSAALTLSSISTQGMMLLLGALAPHLSRSWGSGDHDGLVRVSRRITDLLLITSSSLSLLLILFSHELVTLTFGPAFRTSEPSLAILGIGTLGLASAAANHLMQLSTNARFPRDINVIGALALFALAVALVGPAGIEGAASSRALVQCSIGGATCYFVARRFHPTVVSGSNVAVCAAVVLLGMVVQLARDPAAWMRAAFWMGCVAAICLSVRTESGVTVVGREGAALLAGLLRKPGRMRGESDGAAPEEG